MRRKIGIDLDNTLCVGKHWETPEECLEAEPIQGTIEFINHLYKNNFVVIYTARQNFLMSATFDWLDKHGVYYHAVSNRKVPFDMLIDDTALSLEEQMRRIK